MPAWNASAGPVCGCSVDDVGTGQQRRTALVGGHTDILKDIGRNQKLLSSGAGIETPPLAVKIYAPAAVAAAVKTVGERPIAGCATAALDSCTQRRDMRHFVGRDFTCILDDDRVGQTGFAARCFTAPCVCAPVSWLAGSPFR